MSLSSDVCVHGPLVRVIARGTMFDLQLIGRASAAEEEIIGFLRRR